MLHRRNNENVLHKKEQFFPIEKRIYCSCHAKPLFLSFLQLKCTILVIGKLDIRLLRRTNVRKKRTKSEAFWLVTKNYAQKLFLFWEQEGEN